MKFGKYPVASIVLLVLFGIKFLSSYLFPDQYASLEPVFTIIIKVSLVLFVLYYVYVFITAWRNRHKEDA